MFILMVAVKSYIALDANLWWKNFYLEDTGGHLGIICLSKLYIESWHAFDAITR